jgi:hypothetical protein
MKNHILWQWSRFLIKTNLQRFAVGAVLICAGVLTGAALTSTHAARAEGQSAPQPQHFQSGSQLSLPVLKEIAATLKQIDARLARLETAAQQLRPSRVTSAPTN